MQTKRKSMTAPATTADESILFEEMPDIETAAAAPDPAVLDIATRKPASPEKTNDELCAEVTAELNGRYALVQIGSTTEILDMAAPRFKTIKKQAFFDLHANQKVWLRKGKGKESYSKAKIWLEHPDRLTFDEVVFRPGHAPEPGQYNLWRGWTHEPDAAAGACDLFLAHIRDNVARGDEVRERWVLSFLADIIQNPDRKLGVSLALIGEQGVGKSTIGDVMGELLGEHSRMVDQARYITGNFNSHLETCLLLRAEEATWAGDKSAAGVLKSLITGQTIMIERKGREPVEIGNFCRILFTSNEAWVVPAGTNDRRFTVLEVSNERRQDHAYFRAIWDQLRANDGGGFRALMAYLLEYPVDEAFLRRTLRTEELAEQQVHGLEPHQAWLLEILQAGALPGGEGATVIKQDLWRAYIEHAGLVGARYRSAQTQLGMMLKKILKGRVADKAGKRPDGAGQLVNINTLTFPPLAECRALFDEWLGSKISWSDPTADWADPQADLLDAQAARWGKADEDSPF